MSCRAEQLLALGQSVWLDFIRRGPLVSGEFERQVREDGVVGVTSNPTIFQQAIAKSTDYDTALAAHIALGLSGEALFESLAIEDIQMACDRMRAVYDRSAGMDGRVSIEVSPKLANDGPGTLVAAKRLHAAVGRVKGIRRQGVRVGNWLPAHQAEQLVNSPAGEPDDADGLSVLKRGNQAHDSHLPLQGGLDQKGKHVLAL